MTQNAPSISEGWLGEIKDWQIVEANRITYGIGEIAVIGKVLIGPHDIGAQAFIPPGVWSNTPEDFEKPVSNAGWRRGVWTNIGSKALADIRDQDIYPVTGEETRLVWVDGTERPVSLRTDGLGNIDRKIKQEAPDEFSDFAEEITANRIKQLKFNLSEEEAGEQEREYVKELGSLTADASAAFGSQWVKTIISSGQY